MHREKRGGQAVLTLVPFHIYGTRGESMDAAGQLIARLPPWLGQPAARALTGGHAWLTELRLKAGRNVLLYGRTGCKKLSELSA